MGPDPLTLTVAIGRVWVINADDGTLSMIDPGSGTEKRLPLRETVGVASGRGAVWVAYDGNRLARLDGRTGRVVKMFRLGEQTPVQAARLRFPRASAATRSG